MNPNKTIEYSTTNHLTNEDIFEKLIKRIRTLQLLIEKNKQAWNYLLYGFLMFILAIIAYYSTTN